MSLRLLIFFVGMVLGVCIFGGPVLACDALCVERMRLELEIRKLEAWRAEMAARRAERARAEWLAEDRAARRMNLDALRTLDPGAPLVQDRGFLHEHRLRYID